MGGASKTPIAENGSSLPAPDRVARAAGAVMSQQGTEVCRGRSFPAEGHFRTWICSGDQVMETTWKPHEKHGELTERSDLPDSVFAFPKQRKEPMTDASHVRNAIARFGQTVGGS